MYGLLAEAGCLVVTGMATPAELQAVRSELDPYLEAAKVEADDAEAFYPGHTRRVIALMHRSPTLCQLMTHPTVEHLGDRHLLENCVKWQLNVTAALEIGPGARDQILHREEDLYPHWTPPRPNLILASMWAISEFTAANGGTLIVPGCHRWDADRVAKPNEIVRAQMQPGSVLFWLGEHSTAAAPMSPVMSGGMAFYSPTLWGGCELRKINTCRYRSRMSSHCRKKRAPASVLIWTTTGAVWVFMILEFWLRANLAIASEPARMRKS